MVNKISVRNQKDFCEKLFSFKTNKKLCDAELIVNGERIGVHANVLAASSNYFESIFIESGLKEVSFIDMNLEVVLSLIQYCYTGKIEISDENVNEVLFMAKILSIPTIIEDCSIVLKSKLNIDTCLTIWKIAKEGNSDTLKQSAFNYAKENFERICTSEEFLALEYSDLKELLDSNINIKSEETVFEALKNWLRHDKVLRKNNFVSLLDHVKLSCLSQKMLISESRSLCDLNSNCLNKIIDAIEAQDDFDYKNCRESNTIIAIGENTTNVANKIDVFDIVNQKWIEINTSINKIMFSTVLLEDKLMLIGGKINESIVNTIDCYDLKQGKLETFPPMKYARFQLSAIEYKGNVFVIGGKNGDEVLSYVEKWDPLLMSWTIVPPLSVARFDCGVNIVKNKIFVVGGYSGKQYLSSVEAYDPINKKWEMYESMLTPRYSSTAVTLNGYLYTVGGSNKDGDMKTGERYDPTNNTWKTIAPIEVARRYLAGAKLMGKLVIAGGAAGTQRVSTVETYDENQNEWKPMVPLNTPRHFFCLVEVPWSLAKHAINRK